MKKYKIAEDSLLEIKEELSEYSDLEIKILRRLGIKRKEDAQKFLNPSYEKDLHDPFLMKGMDGAVERILRAIKENEKITIYTDYDCDGISAGVILKDFFEEIGFTNFENYIPHRHDEGYGLNESAVKEIAKNGTKLLITADCGSSDTETIALARELGMDTIITDHHEVPEVEPEAREILNPKRKDCLYPDKNISGAVVVFKLIQALIKKGDFNLIEGKEKWLLDLVGLSVIADMVPLVSENRVFARFGLLVLSKSRRIGLFEILNKMNIKQKFISEDDVSFMLAPRINACSRMDSPDKAFELLSTKEKEKAALLADEINKMNDKRKGVVASMIKEIKSKIDARGELSKVLVSGNPKWKPALLGLAANTLVKDYERPVFLWGREGNGVLKGSCRSAGGADVCALMEEARGLLLEYGGHKFAGGFSISFENVHFLEDKLSEIHKKMESVKTEEEIFVDSALNVSDVNRKTFEILQKFSPFGEGNPKPVFLFKEARISFVKTFGKEDAHLSITFENGNGSVRGIRFFYKNDFSKNPKEGEVVDVVGSIESSFFSGKSELRIRILDLI